MDPSTAQAKFRGALLGAAVGDALGAPFEGHAHVPADVLARFVERPGRLRFTDDTHMTLGVAQSLVERRGFDGAHMAATFARNFAAEPWRGYGAGPPEVFRLLGEGVPWNQASSKLFGGRGSAGNGAAMRVTPVALFACPRLPMAAWLARQTALITHAHPLGVEGAVLQACAVTLLLQHPSGARLDVPRFVGMLRGQLHGSAYREKVDLVAELVYAGDDQGACRLGNGVLAEEAVPGALYAFLRQPDSFANVVTYAIRHGGDTDTIASMAGALAGAYLGEHAIPDPWRENVEAADELRRLADELLALAAGRIQVRPGRSSGIARCEER
jgi:poly(ADP-ribose) glycohydrolase ARH3